MPPWRAFVSGSGTNGGLNAGGRLQPPKVAIESTELENVFLAYCAFCSDYICPSQLGNFPHAKSS